VTQSEVGQSTLGAIKVWMDDVSGRLNTEERGTFLGDFDTGDSIFALYNDGSYEVLDYDLTKRFDLKEVITVEKFDPATIVNAVYYEGNKGWTMVKRFLVETTKNNQRFNFLSDHKSTKLLFASVKEYPFISYNYKVKNKKTEGELDFVNFIDLKGWKALGNRLADHKITTVKEIIKEESEKPRTTKKATKPKTTTKTKATPKAKAKPAAKAKAKPTAKKATPKKTTRKKGGKNGRLKPGDSIELDF